MPAYFEEKYVSDAPLKEIGNRKLKENKILVEQFKELHSDKEILGYEDYDSIMAMKKVMDNHFKASKLFSDGIPETSMYWNDEETSLLCKCRIDYLGENCIVDLKTTRDVASEAFSKSIYEFKYFIQSAFYQYGVKSVLDKDLIPVIIPQEKKPPYAIKIYTLKNDLLIRGRELYKWGLKLYKKCLDRQDWPGYEESIEEIDMPQWAWKKEKDYNNLKFNFKANESENETNE